MALTGVHPRLRAWLGLALIGLVWLVATAQPAAAHAVLAGSNPSPDEVLATAPRSVTLIYDEPVAPVDAAFVLYDSDGPVGDGGSSSSLSVSAIDATVSVDLPSGLKDGSYLLGWRVVSADGHPIGGALPFAVGAPSAEPPDAPPTAADGFSGPVLPLAVALQILGYAGLLTAAGLGVVQGLVLRTATRRRRGLLTGCAAVGAVATVLLAGVDIVREQALPLGRLLDADLWRTGLTGAPGLAAVLGVVGAVLLVLGVTRDGVPGRALTLVGALAAVATVLPTGHTRTYGPGPLMYVLDLVHAGSAAVWLGGVVALGLHLSRTRRAAADPVSVAGDVVRFSGLAGALVVLLGISGVVMSIIVLGSPRAVVETGYGRALVVKLAVVAVVAVLAIGNKTWLVGAVGRRPHAEAQWRRLRGAVRDEALLLVVVLALTGLLTVQSPRSLTDVAAANASGTASDLQRVPLGNGSLQARLAPGRVGSNTLSITLRDSDGGPLTPTALPTVTARLRSQGLTGIEGVVTAVDGINRYEAELQLPVAGDWTFIVSVPTGVQADVTAVTVAVAR